MSTLGAVWLAASSCSVLYDLNTKQCNTDDECHHKGSAFANSICQNNVCVAISAPNTGGAPSTGGQSSEATGGDVSAGGVDTGGAGGTTDTGGTTSVTTTAPACTNAKCTTDNNGVPAICKNGACIPLTTIDCPILIPKKTASDLIQKNDGVIVVGGFASMSNSSDLYDTQAVINWDMAFNEFNTYTITKGLPAYGGSGVRPLVGLICQGYKPTTDTINAAMKQLSDVVGVPAILSTLPANYLYQAWQYIHPDLDGGTAPNPIFFVNTGSANLNLVNNIQNDGLMWHMLGDPRVLASTTVALLKQMEPYINKQRAAAGDTPSATNPLRVTLVYSDDPTMLDIASLLTAPAVDATHPDGTILTFNGKLALSNGSAFRQVQIDSATQHPTPSVINAVKDLQNNPPHVIVAMATSEFPKTVIPSVENTWTSGTMRPFYVLSHRIYNGTDLQTDVNQFSTTSPELGMRMAGVNFAMSQETRAINDYNSYLPRLTSYYSSNFSGTLSLTGTENYYDGAYYTLYAIAAAAASRNRPSAIDISDGLLSRVIYDRSGAVSVDVGPDAITGASTGTAGTVAQLFSNVSGYKMSVYGCDGPPNFDRLTGVRASPTSAWCILTNKVYQPDGLYFDPNTKIFSTASAGVPSCLQMYCPSQADAGVSTCPASY